MQAEECSVRILVVPSLILASLSSACFRLPSQAKGSVQVLNTEPRVVETRTVGDSKSVASYDPMSKVATKVEAPKGALAGSNITLPAGSLAVSAELIVEEAVPLSETSLASAVGISETIEVRPLGAGLIIRPSEHADLTQPLTIAMPISPFSSLIGRLQQRLGLQSKKHYAVFFKYFVRGELRAGVISSSELRLTSDGLVAFEGYFGAYWLAEVSSPLEQRVEVPSQEPIVNKDRVAVIEATGIVSEQQVVAKAQIPSPTWGAIDLNFDELTRQLRVSATIEGTRTVSQCKLDLFRDQSASTGTIVETQNSINVTITLDREDALTFQARFRCLDDQARLTVSAWSSLLSIPVAHVIWTTPTLTLAGRTVTLSAQIHAARSVQDCRAEFSEDGGTSIAYQTVTGTVLNHTQILSRQDAHTLQGRFRCSDDLGRPTLSAWSPIVSVPTEVMAAPMWTSVNLTLMPATRMVTLTGILATTPRTFVCSARFSELPNLSEGYAISIGQGLAASYVVNNVNAHMLYARFECFDEKDSLFLSPITSLNMPAYPFSAPLLASPGHRLFPTNFLRAGTSYQVDFDNVASSPFNDFGMTYTCSFSKLTTTNGPPTACTSLWGSSFSATHGFFSWTPAPWDVGAYQFTVTGTNVAGTSTQSFTLDVAPDIDTNQLLLALDGRFADAVRGGMNSTANTSKWFDLTSSGKQATLYNFDPTATWFGTNTSGDPVHLRFDGYDDYLDVPTLNLSGQSELRFETWLMDENSTSERIIMTNANSAQRGWTLTNRRLMLGLGGGGSYSSTVLAASPSLYWRFNTIAEGIVPDWSANNRYGTIENPANVQLIQETAFGPIAEGGSALNTGSGYYRVTPPFQSGLNWTIETWFRYPLTCNEAWCSLVRGVSDNDHHFTIVKRDTNHLGIALKTEQDTTFYSSGYSLNALSPGWHHLTVVGQAGTTQFYLDGASVGSVLSVQPTGLIGSIGGDGGSAWGQIDELAIYASAQTATQIQTHFLAGFVPQCTYKSIPGQWQHLAATVSDTTNQLRLWMNGSQVCSLSKLPTMPFQASGTPLTLGRSTLLGNTHSWGGRLSNLAIYSQAQSNSINSNFQATGPAYSGISRSGLVTWLQAGQGLFQDLNRTIPAQVANDPVAAWTDQSGSGVHFDSSSAGDPMESRGTLRTNILNGWPVVAFDGVMDTLRTHFSYGSPNTVFLVARQTGEPRGRVLTSLANNWLLGWWGNGADCAHFEYWLKNCTDTDNSWRIYMSDQAGNTDRLFRSDQLLAESFSAISQGPSGLALGGIGGYQEPSKAEVAELIVYQRVLSDTERAAVFAYLSSKYGL
jgi:hypothetical protein